MKKALRLGIWGFSALVLLLIAFLALVYWQLEASLPQLAGHYPLSGLLEEVNVFRDAQGVPVIRGRSRLDVARAMGYVHAQERFFQMDLMRRRAAGELAALVGSAALDVDKATRLHRFRFHAHEIIERLPANDRQVLTAYTEGVNAGLLALGKTPFEYFFLRTEPQTWQPEDSILVVYSMYLSLQPQDGSDELFRQQAKAQIPTALYRWLSTTGTEWDAPLSGDSIGKPALPSSADLANYTLQMDRPASEYGNDDSDFPGSNNWAVAGAHTASAAAMLANDMHLGIAVPNTWFRAQMSYNDGERDVRVTGVTLPGAPVVVAGSNEHIAWGFTNSYIDVSDVIVLDMPDATHYQTPDGIKEFRHIVEKIDVKGGDSYSLDIAETEWGPVFYREQPKKNESNNAHNKDKDQDGKAAQQYVYHWLAHDPEQAINLNLLHLEGVQNTLDAVSIAHGIRIPAQNFVVADTDGSIAWTIAGAIPRRVGFDGQLPTHWADPAFHWDGYLSSEETPVMMNPLEGRIWTANNRVVSAETLKVIGNGGYDLGARAHQIRDDLRQQEQFSERDMLKIQLDDRAVFLTPWHDHLLTLLNDEAVAGSVERTKFKTLLSDWQGHAAIDSVSYRLVRDFRYLLHTSLMHAWLRPVYNMESEFRSSALSNQWEANVWQAITEQPTQLLPKPFGTWRELELAVVDAEISALQKKDKHLERRTWGERNTTAIRHPLSRFIPFLGYVVDAPKDKVAGDSNMPHVMGPNFGASERFVVTPGHEDQGLFHMPTSQSGHPMSPYYMIGHAAWVKGEATPFLPGDAVYKMYLQPEKKALE